MTDELIRTTEHYRNCIDKHFAQLDRFLEPKSERQSALGDDCYAPVDYKCYFCEAALQAYKDDGNLDEHPRTTQVRNCSQHDDIMNYCDYCPLGNKYQKNNYSCITARREQLVNKFDTRRSEDEYMFATRESIKERYEWLEEQVEKFTDCSRVEYDDNNNKEDYS